MHKLHIDLPTQKLFHYLNDVLISEYSISSALKGVGEQKGSEQTPRGWHIIRAKIGDKCKEGTIFVARRETGEVFSSTIKNRSEKRDWILSRIMWLSGLEKGKNRLGNVDTMQRYIYIHGVPDIREMGVPGSKGCINMTNKEIIKLYDMIPVGTKVFIKS